jgi:hypothetical protein
MMRAARYAVVFTLCAVGMASHADTPAARVERFEVRGRSDAFGGAGFCCERSTQRRRRAQPTQSARASDHAALSQRR